MPTVSCRSSWNASFSLVPTPSVPETSTGSRYFFGISASAPNPPMPASTSGRRVRFAERLDRLDERVARVDVHPCVAVGDRFLLVKTGGCG